MVCGEDVEMCPAKVEVIGNHHSGCFGYPMCSCIPSHQGDCFHVKTEEQKIELQQHLFRRQAWFWLTPNRYPEKKS